jgi:ParB family chromosome partitioning protein
MAKKKQALGRGLSALLQDTKAGVSSASDKNAEKIVGNIVDLDIKLIKVNPFQPRTHFDENALDELADSIKELGIIQPITVRKVTGNKFELVSGERRFRASKLVGLKTIPAYVRIANDQEMLEMALVENIQRRDLDPIEVALSYQRLLEEIKLTQNELGKRVGKKRSTVTNYLRLLKLDPIIQTGMRDGFIGMGHGRALINIEETETQLVVYKKILDQHLSVRQTEQLVKQLKEPQSKKIVTTTIQPEFIKENTSFFNNYFGNKIKITVSGKGKGSIKIPFESKEDFIRIKNLLKK